MLCDQVMMCDLSCLGKAGGSTAEHQEGCCTSGKSFVIKRDPGLFTMLKQGPPRAERRLILIGEQKHLRRRYVDITARLEKCAHKFVFRNDQFGLRHLQCVLKLQLGIPWVGTNEDSASSDNALDEDGIVDVVEGMNADAIALLDAERSKSSDELSDQLVSLPS